MRVSEPRAGGPCGVGSRSRGLKGCGQPVTHGGSWAVRTTAAGPGVMLIMASLMSWGRSVVSIPSQSGHGSCQHLMAQK